VRKHAGEAGFIQRCQVHKKRNVVDHVPDEQADVKRKLQNAYAMATTPMPSAPWIDCTAS
jgi:transposase-like protein